MTTPTLIPSWKKAPLARIDAIVAAHLGETRVPGNAHPAALNRQIAMYLAKQVGGWSYKAIGRFYNGRDHSTVHYAVQRVEALRESSPDLDLLLCELKRAIFEVASESPVRRQSADWHRDSRKIVTLAKNEAMLEALAERVAAKLRTELAQILSLVQKPGEGDPVGRNDSTAHLEASDLLETLHGFGRGER
jgi:Bacterial dnaA protein helix-turn-helix